MFPERWTRLAFRPGRFGFRSKFKEKFKKKMESLHPNFSVLLHFFLQIFHSIYLTFGTTDQCGWHPFLIIVFRMRSRIVTVGIAPWGLVQSREQLVGRDAHICYERQSPPDMRGGSNGVGDSAALEDAAGRGASGLPMNDRHSYFLLADNGTVNRYGKYGTAASHARDWPETEKIEIHWKSEVSFAKSNFRSGPGPK